MSDTLNAKKALIFRILHRDNVAWLLKHGLHCGTSETRDPNYVSIGNADLIASRKNRDIPIEPGGTLSDYVPFYFTPFSPMMYNIKTGYRGITRRRNEEIVILVSSLPRMSQLDVPYVFSDRHAYLRTANFYSSLSDLDQIDWKILQARDFRYDANDPLKMDRYQAEALIFRHCPTEALLGIGCYDNKTKSTLVSMVKKHALEIEVVTKAGWYFQ